ncbi:PGAP1-like protein-domain-containing protein [Umbelopsis sp. PMI_123]|nr:PGAP1-like protein-domain-containing protein [Umbelopsis sp. PMI_123]
MTKFAGKYTLYLYREKGVDNNDQPVGVPVLFIPGHAGSYKQCRSIAAEAAYLFYGQNGRQRVDRDRGRENLDIFTVDFNEEFSALHGQSILEQAEYLNDAIDYILKLYPQTRKNDGRFNPSLPDPQSVIIIGHSMGGVVARAMLTIDNYQPGHINTIITLSTPHISPPVPFDWMISKIYKDIHQFWIDGYSTAVNDRERSLRDVALISIAGGNLDSIVCSDSANIGAIVPSTHGFTVFTTAIPNVWTGSDHPAILWCNQIVGVLAKSLLDIVDTRRGGQTKPLDARMQVFRKAFLSGLEQDRRTSDIPFIPSPVVKLPGERQDFTQDGYRIAIHGSTTDSYRMIRIPFQLDTTLTQFALLTDIPLGEPQRFSMLLCNPLDNTYRPISVTRNNHTMTCVDASGVAVPVPASSINDRYPFDGNKFYYLKMHVLEMVGYEYVMIVDRGGPAGFVFAEFYDELATRQVIDVSMTDIALHGISFSTPAKSNTMLSSVQIPAMESAMLAYHLRVSRPKCIASQNLFAPFLRQSISSMYESKFYVNLGGESGTDVTDITFHGQAAFTTNPASQSGNDHRGLLLQFWMDPTCSEPMEVKLDIDWYGSIGRLAFRNGVILGVFPFIIVVMVVLAQIQCYNKTGIFPHFGQGLVYCLRNAFPMFLILASACSIYQTIATSTTYTISEILQLGPATSQRVPERIARATFDWDEVILGSHDPFFWWVPMVFFVVSVGTVVVVWGILILVLRTSSTIATQVKRRKPPTASAEPDLRRLHRRVITTIVLFVLVATFIPYQFAFVVGFLVQLVTCSRAIVKATFTSDPVRQRRYWNRYHYLQSILILLFTLLPLNVPVLMVWIRNLSVHWFVPFSSDHSVLAIAPFMIYVEMMTGTRMLPRSQDL